MASNSIREKAITELTTRLAEISIAHGYENDFTGILRGQKKANESDLPYIAVLPGMETETAVCSMGNRVVDVPIEATKAFDWVTENPSVIAETMLADLKANLKDTKLRINFTVGSHAPVAGERITGATSAVSAHVLSVAVSSGSWGAGTAAGYIVIRDMRGNATYTDFIIGENLNDPTPTLCCKVASVALNTGTDFAYVADIKYSTGGVLVYPNPDEKVITVHTEWTITYFENCDNPYINQ
jgi:hypothetical protein